MFKLKIITLILSVSVNHLFAQVSDSTNRIDKKGLKQGSWVKKDDTGNIIYKGTFVNDKPIGKFIYYYPTGNTKSITTFYKKDRQAFTQLFSPDGKRISQGKINGESKDSTWTFYNDNDSVSSIDIYVNGKRNGICKTFYKSGKLLEEANYKDDVLNGTYKKYYESGTLNMVCINVNGLHEGIAKFYYPSGQMSIEGFYKNDFKDGVWNYYSENGSLEWKVTYKRSNMIGKIRYNGIEEEFYPNKMPQSKITFKNGMKNGFFTEYYDAGQVKQETIPAKDGYPEEIKETITGQKIKRKGNYLNDKLDGKVIYYQLDGKIEKEETYKNGVLLK